MQSQCCGSDTYFRSLQFLNLMARKMKVGTADLCCRSWLLLLCLKMESIPDWLSSSILGASRVSALRQAHLRQL